MLAAADEPPPEMSRSAAGAPLARPPGRPALFLKGDLLSFSGCLCGTGEVVFGPVACSRPGTPALQGLVGVGGGGLCTPAGDVGFSPSGLV